MNALQKLVSRRDNAHRDADQAEEKARKLSTVDPDAAVGALAEATNASLRADVAEMAIDEHERQSAEDTERQEQAAQKQAQRKLKELRGEQYAVAETFTEAMDQLEACFLEMEALHKSAEKLSRNTNLNSDAISFPMRTTALHKAIWHGAPSLAKRLRLAGIPGGRSKAAPLTDTYPED